jgi:hypothetical protein
MSSNENRFRELSNIKENLDNIRGISNSISSKGSNSLSKRGLDSDFLKYIKSIITKPNNKIAARIQPPILINQIEACSFVGKKKTKQNKTKQKKTKRTKTTTTTTDKIDKIESKAPLT